MSVGIAFPLGGDLNWSFSLMLIYLHCVLLPHRMVLWSAIAVATLCSLVIVLHSQWLAWFSHVLSFGGYC